MKLFLCRPNTTLPFSHIIKQAVSTAAYYYFIVALRWKGKAGGVGDWKTNRLSFLIHEATAATLTTDWLIFQTWKIQLQEQNINSTRESRQRRLCLCNRSELTGEKFYHPFSVRGTLGLSYAKSSHRYLDWISCPRWLVVRKLNVPRKEEEQDPNPSHDHAASGR